MKENEVIEGNKLIAEFMGILESSGTTLSESGIIVSAKGYDYRGEFLLLDELRYNTSWDWLMPVIDKIETDRNYAVILSLNQCEIKCKVMSDTTRITSADLAHGSNYSGKNSKLSNTWLAVVEFIKWYNSR